MKSFLLSLLIAVSLSPLWANGFSLSFSESVRSPVDETKPIDYEISFATQYSDTLDIYYCQERDNGKYQLEYWVMLQRQMWKSVWLSAKRQDTPDNEIWSVDIKCNINSNKWKTFIGYSNCWENGKYKPKMVAETHKSYGISFFLTPIEIVASAKVLADNKNLYHEEKLEMKFLMVLPASWKLDKHIDTYIKLFVLSKDYGYYRLQQKLMLEVNFK